ncbi:MAG: hypothetical protein Q4F72_09310 [Desulfovibrionaceae bacterium]|nr:hypothetical protein [Desulfovibrionaceae bacterium]
MARTLYKSDIMEFEDELREITCNGEISRAQLVRDIARAVAENVRRDPKSYRAFGPYWWIVKRIMLDNGITEFGSFIDREWHRMCDYGNDFDSAFAAWTYFGQSLQVGRIHVRDHEVYFAPRRGEANYKSGVYRLLDYDIEMNRPA